MAGFDIAHSVDLQWKVGLRTSESTGFALDRVGGASNRGDIVVNVHCSLDRTVEMQIQKRKSLPSNREPNIGWGVLMSFARQHIWAQLFVSDFMSRYLGALFFGGRIRKDRKQGSHRPRLRQHPMSIHRRSRTLFDIRGYAGHACQLRKPPSHNKFGPLYS